MFSIFHFAPVSFQSQLRVVYLYLSDLGLDMQDSTGRHEVGHDENVTRLPVNDGEGCHFIAFFKINRVWGVAFLCTVEHCYVM